MATPDSDFAARPPRQQPDPGPIPGNAHALARSIDRIVGLEGASATLHTAIRTTIIQGLPVPIERLGIALEPWPTMPAWAEQEGLDGLFLHRHWGAQAALSASRVAVVASHEGFDRRFGFGDNPELRAVLGLRTVARLAERDGFPLGTVAEGVARSLATWRSELVAVFGGLDADTGGAADRSIGRVAIARAMTADLVREAADLGADTYVTGQLRKPAMAAAADAGLHVVAVGHRRSERWALRALATALVGCWPGLVVRIAPHDAPGRA